MRMTGKTVIVRNLAVSTPIGVHAHEKQAPQRLLVSVEVQCRDNGDEHDRLGATVDYDRICDFIRGLAGRGHVELQETVARSVLDFVMADPAALSAVVETRKPDILDDCDYVGVRMSAARET